MDKQAILNGEITEYNFTTVESMDNIQSMDYFVNLFDLCSDVALWGGTYIELWNSVGVNSGGNGDFYSHKIKFEIL